MSCVHTPAAGGAGAGESAGAVAVVGPSAESVRAGCRYGSAVLPPSELPDVPPYDPSLELSTGAMCLYPGTDSSGETLRSDCITHADVHAFRSLCLFWRRLTKATNRARAMGAVVRLEKQAEADAPDRVSKVLAAANRLRALQDSTAGGAFAPVHVMPYHHAYLSDPMVQCDAMPCRDDYRMVLLQEYATNVVACESAERGCQSPRCGQQVSELREEAGWFPRWHEEGSRRDARCWKK